MIGVSGKAGEIRLSFSDDEYVRVTGAGRAETERERPRFSGDEYVLLCGRGVCVQAGEESLLLAENEAVLLAPDTAFYTWGVPVYIRFFSPHRLFDGAVMRVRCDAAQRIEALICGKMGRETGARLTSELCAVVCAVAECGEECDEIEEAKAYLERYYDQPVDMGMLADAVGYSRGYFTAKFTADTGCSPYKYLTLVRMKNARRMLAGGGMSVAAVAAACGYAGAERFCEMFRKYTGMSPHKYAVWARTQKTEESLCETGEKSL